MDKGEMMLHYYEGTVFNAGATAIVNTVNCTGVMGAGIALEFMLRYPNMFEDYKSKCEEKKYLPGTVNYFKENEITIVNFSTKWHFKYPSKIQWIENGLIDFCKTYKAYNIESVAFPRLGTSNGGLNWNDVKPLMEKYLSKIDAEVYICLDSKQVAEGIELEMLNRFNSLSIDGICDIVKLNKTQKENINAKMPYNRFWKISETEKIGIKTYSELFKYFYGKAVNGEEIPQQITLF